MKYALYRAMNKYGIDNFMIEEIKKLMVIFGDIFMKKIVDAKTLMINLMNKNEGSLEIKEILLFLDFLYNELLEFDILENYNLNYMFCLFEFSVRNCIEFNYDLLEIGGNIIYLRKNLKELIERHFIDDEIFYYLIEEFTENYKES